MMIVRRIIEYIKVMPDRSIEVVLKGGMKEVEKVYGKNIVNI